MAKHGDQRSVGRSKLVPFVPGEDAGSRHQRRLVLNLKAKGELEAWCRERGVQFKVGNDGHHWRFKRGELVAEWWPSSAKLVLQQRYEQGVHVHDHEQARKLLARHFSPLPPAPPPVMVPPDPLHPSGGLLAKLGSLIVHFEEGISDKGHPFDAVAMRQCFADPEVVAWLEGMRKLALLPVKRERRGQRAGHEGAGGHAPRRVLEVGGEPPVLPMPLATRERLGAFARVLGVPRHDEAARGGFAAPLVEEAMNTVEKRNKLHVVCLQLREFLSDKSDLSVEQIRVMEYALDRAQMQIVGDEHVEPRFNATMKLCAEILEWCCGEGNEPGAGRCPLVPA